MTAPRSAPRPCPLCGNPTATGALVEAHVGPTKQHPKADVVLWLCPPCATEVTEPRQPPAPRERPAAVSSHRTPAPLQRAPTTGPVGGREPGTPTQGRTRPPPPTQREEVNRMRHPSVEELQRQVEEDGGCEATDGCFVEPDGTCDHGQPSWLLALGLI
jgi:hypothetical protein